MSFDPFEIPVIDPKLTNPSTEHWDRVFALFSLVF
ncbi:DUF1931 family protein [Mycobacterium xenopi]|nr:DUF1931 family protein [Mycobacterium xenopi]MDA3637922.1 DUF1931 family protein [Mycobacterium xenopi]MDA3655991.1 DUF1931 family protein [Mycobacterium xenopi]MDA3660691.1 DUF1931 family protein [Mycobacterium xenopi]